MYVFDLLFFPVEISEGSDDQSYPKEEERNFRILSFIREQLDNYL